MLQSLLDLVYPRHCVRCERVLNLKEKSICTPCIIEYNKQLEFPPSEKQIKSKFGIEFMPDDVFSLFPFGEDTSVLIHALKYRSQKQVAVYIAEWMVKKYFFQAEKETDLLIPVPVNYIKRLTRGFNQTELIAGKISAETRIPVLNSALKRNYGTWKFAGKNRQERYKLISGIYSGGKQIANVKGKNVMLVDDVITTGATLEHCGRILLEAGAKKIHIMSLATVC